MNQPVEPWLALLGPLPDGVLPGNAPVEREGIAPDPSSPIRGWRALTMEVGTGGKNYRIVHVVVDDSGLLLSASDHVVRRSNPSSPGGEIEQFSIGGRFEVDGTFNGTCWHVAGVEGENEGPDWRHTPRTPTVDEIAALRVVVGEMLRRDNGRPSVQ